MRDCLETMVSDANELRTAATCMRCKHGDEAERKAREYKRQAQLAGDRVDQNFWQDVLTTVIADRDSPNPVHYASF